MIIVALSAWCPSTCCNKIRFLNPAQSCVLRECKRKKPDLGVIVLSMRFFSLFFFFVLRVGSVHTVIHISRVARRVGLQ